MVPEFNFLQTVARVAHDILEPIVATIGGAAQEEERKEFLTALGLDPDKAAAAPPVPAAGLDSVKAYLSKAAGEADELAFFAVIDDLAKVTAAIKAFVEFTKFGNSPNLQASEATTAFLNLALLNYIRQRAPLLHKILSIVDAIDEQSLHAGGILNLGHGIKEFIKRVIEAAELKDEAQAKDFSDTVLFVTGVVLTLLNRLVFRKFGIPLEIDAAYGYDGDPTSCSPLADQLLGRSLSFSIRTLGQGSVKLSNTLAFVPKNGFVPQADGGPAAIVQSSGGITADFDLTDIWKVRMEAGDLGATYRIGKGTDIAPLVNPHVKIAFERNTDEKTVATFYSHPFIKLGYARTKISVQFSKDDIELRFKPTVVFQAGKGLASSFPWSLLPAGGVDTQFELPLGFGLKRGFFIDGGGSGGGITIAFPIYKSVGSASTFLFSFDLVTIAYTSDEATKEKSIELSLSFSFTIASIIKASVSRTGILLKLKESPDGTGLIAGYDPGVDFKAPNGIGVAVDAGIVKGGGFLYFDQDAGEYFGALELSFQKLFSLKAVGIINTKMPDGSEGYSLLIIITADDFNWQIGMGFSIRGFGGILGLQRTVKMDVLLDGLKTNTLKSILFPQDVVANISRIISDLKQVFPVEKDHFLVGPMVKMAWGGLTPLVTLELGIIVDFPDPRVIILGVLKIALPKPDMPVLRLQANFIGVIDIPNRYVFFRADLYDSRLLVFTLTGSIAFLVSWGDEAVFAMSVGGFHPDFHDVPSISALPNGFKNMDRISTSLLSGGSYRASLLSYYAVTSNTVQFGSRIELYAEACGFNVYGYLGYDVLFQLNPFHFDAGFSAGLALRRGSSVIMGISLSGTLSGPKPWHLKGQASFSILFFDVSVDINKTWGDDPEAVEEIKEDLQALLVAEIQNDQNWQAVLPASSSLRVSVRDRKSEQQQGGGAPPPKPVIHPVGVLTFSQRLVPLDVKIEKFGTRKPKDVAYFHIASVKSGAATLARADAKERFAPAHFFEMKDNEKLARRSFESFNSGFRVQGASDLHISAAINKSVDYELSYLRKKRFTAVFGGVFKYHKSRFRQQLRGNAVANSPLSHASNRPSPNAPDAVVMAKEQYIVANKGNMKPYSNELVAPSYAEAVTMYNDLLVKQPSLKNKVQIISQFEQNLN